MGSSLILQGGAAVAKTLKESVTQTGHGFTVGDVIRWDGLQVPPKYVKAIADTAQNAEVAGVVSSTPIPMSLRSPITGTSTCRHWLEFLRLSCSCRVPLVEALLRPHRARWERW